MNRWVALTMVAAMIALYAVPASAALLPADVQVRITDSGWVWNTDREEFVPYITLLLTDPNGLAVGAIVLVDHVALDTLLPLLGVEMPDLGPPPMKPLQEPQAPPAG